MNAKELLVSQRLRVIDFGEREEFWDIQATITATIVTGIPINNKVENRHMVGNISDYFSYFIDLRIFQNSENNVLLMIVQLQLM